MTVAPEPPAKEELSQLATELKDICKETESSIRLGEQQFLLEGAARVEAPQSCLGALQGGRDGGRELRHPPHSFKRRPKGVETADERGIPPTSLKPYFPALNMEYGIRLKTESQHLGLGSYGHGGGYGTLLAVHRGKHLTFAMGREGISRNTDR